MLRTIINYLAFILTTAAVALGGIAFTVWVGSVLFSVVTEVPKATVSQSIVPEAEPVALVEPSVAAPEPVEQASRTVSHVAAEVPAVEPIDPIPAWMDGADVDEVDRATARALIFSGSEWNIASHYDAERILRIKDPVMRLSALHFHAVTHYGGWTEAKAYADAHGGVW